MAMIRSAVLMFARIHILRYFRMVNQLGLFRALFLTAVIFYILKTTLRPGMLVWQAVLILSVVAGAHYGRKDHILLGNLGLNKPIYFIALYALFCIPFLLLYLIWFDFRAVSVLVAGIAVTAWFTHPPVKIRKLSLPAVRFLPAGVWEWRVGIRQFMPLIILSYLIPLVFYHQDFLFIAGVLVISITVSSFHVFHEPLSMLRALRTSATNYLHYKIRMQCLFFLILSLPLLIASLTLFPGNFRPLLLVLANSLIVQIFAVTIKYSGYSPGYRSQYNQAISFLLNFAFLFPAMLPLPMIMSAVFYRKALSHLKRTFT